MNMNQILFIHNCEKFNEIKVSTLDSTTTKFNFCAMLTPSFFIHDREKEMRTKDYLNLF